MKPGLNLAPTAPSIRHERFRYEEVILNSAKGHALEQMRDLGERYGLHPLTIEDCINQNQRGKVESYDNYSFVVWHYFDPHMTSPVELHFIVGAEYLVLVSTHAPQGSKSWKELFLDANGSRPEPEFLSETVMRIFDRCVDRTEDYLDALVDKANLLENLILEGAMSPRDILSLKRLAREFDRAVYTMNPIIGQIVGQIEHGGELTLRVRDLTDHVLRIQEHNAQLRVQLNTLLDVYWGAAGARVNAQMQRLTTIATLFVPVSLWSGLFGMNFEHMPFKDKWFFEFGMAVISISFLAVFVYLASRQAFHRHEPFPKASLDFDTPLSGLAPRVTPSEDRATSRTTRSP